MTTSCSMIKFLFTIPLIRTAKNSALHKDPQIVSIKHGHLSTVNTYASLLHLMDCTNTLF